MHPCSREFLKWKYTNKYFIYISFSKVCKVLSKKEWNHSYLPTYIVNIQYWQADCISHISMNNNKWTHHFSMNKSILVFQRYDRYMILNVFIFFK